MLEYNGMKIVESAALSPVAKIEVSPDFQWITDEYRAEINGWLLGMFGTTEPWYVVDNSAISLIGETSSGKFMVTTPKGLAILKSNLENFR